MASGSNHAMRPYAIRGNRRRRQAWPCFSLFVNVQSTFLVTFCQFRRKLVQHRVTRQTRNQDVLFITRGLESLCQFGAGTSPLIDRSTIVASSSTRTFRLSCTSSSAADIVLQVVVTSSSPSCINLPPELEECLGKVSQQVRCSVPCRSFSFSFIFFFGWALSISPTFHSQSLIGAFVAWST